ncbi:uncharacterized protein LOC130206756 isoform X2 [Pseudoliparis swirei]|uniref:uncharacterized protein LOC130206756 isoform X2 n=1 Tax=Pseudoliparis swirei TaxID=2059687 RepID=UPI0024BEAEFE|nr:uncharacterized protein LOC130206756 isoform X2 [Pseudoliparis swirei]
MRPEKPEKEQIEPTFDISYKIFCERIIRQRLLVNQEVLRMGQLRKAFVELVKANEGLDASNYRQDMLKKRLARDFPQLVFHIPTKRNICELVFAETLSTIDITKVSSALGTSVCSALIGIHTFSGCDSTSAFYGKGKMTFSVACEKGEYLKAFKSLGTHFNLEQSTFALLCQYVCHLYDQPAADNVNEARYKAFCMASSALPEICIPPTTDALQQHCKRANYQAAIMRSCRKQKISAPSPAGYGWQIEDGTLHITWMTRNPAPDSVLHVIHCGCKGACETGRCSCFSAGLCCTDLCRCCNCANTKDTEQLEDNCPDTDSED